MVNSNYTFDFPLPIAPRFQVDPETGYPYLKDCLQRNFAFYYFSDKVTNAFQNFYENSEGIRDAFIRFWSKIAQEFKDFDTVLGYELINEPWPGDVYRHPSLLLPGEADKKHLMPLYKDLHSAIRKYDDHHILFFEKAVVDVATPSGFEEGPGGKVNK